MTKLNSNSKNEIKGKIYLSYPWDTKIISVTGRNCELKCKHCGGFFLRGMKDIDEIKSSGDFNSIIEAPDIKDKKSILISGGSDCNGRVPLIEYIDTIRELKEKGFKINLHTGLLSSREIKIICPLADTVSFDFITHDYTIKEVYGLNKTGEDYILTYKEMSQYAPVTPHITVGLLGGEIKGEYNAIDTLRNIYNNDILPFPLEKVIFIIFIPTKGTAYQDRKPPSLNETEKLFEYAKEHLPNIHRGLGCMSPRGSYRKDLERIAYQQGFQSFVNPSRQLTDLLVEEKREIRIIKECCGFRI